MREDIKERIELIKCGKVPEGYQKTKFGIIPKDWEIVRIQDILEKIDNPVKVEAEEEYTQIGIRSHGKGIFYKEPVTGKELGNKRVFWVEPDCFIVNIVFAWECAIARTTKEQSGMIASHRFPMYKPKDKRVNLDYLVLYFMTPKGKEVMEYASPGGAGRNRTLGQERFLNSYIVLPSLREQENIVRMLDLQKRRIDLLVNLQDMLKMEKYILLQKYISGKGRIFDKSSKWSKYKLEQVCEILDSMRKPLNANEREVRQKKYPYYGANGLLDYIDEYIFEDELILLAEDGGNFEDFSLKPIAKYITGKTWVNNHAHVLKVRREFDSKFVFFALEHKDIRVYINGTTRAKLTQEDMKQIRIAIPNSIEEQKKIAKIFTLIDKKRNILSKQELLLKKEADGLGQLLFSGILKDKI
mgnify:FL=1